MRDQPSASPDDTAPARLVCMPQVLSRLLRDVEGGVVDPAQLAEVAGLDPAITLRILTTAGQACATRPRPADLAACLASLGPGLLRAMATGLAVQQAFDNSDSGLRHDLAAFWSHAVLAALIARRLAEASGYERPQEAYLGGLLHDAGQLALLATWPQTYAVLLKASTDETGLLEDEGRLLGTHHAEAGARLLDACLPESMLGDAVLFHHHPAGQMHDAHPLVRLVWAAHALAAGAQRDQAEWLGEIGAVVHLDAATLAGIRAHAMQRCAGIAADLAIRLDPVWADAAQGGMLAALPRLCRGEGMAPAPPAMQAELTTALGEIALMQPIHRALGAVGDGPGMFSALWETSRILTGLPALALFMHDTVTGKLRLQEAGALTPRLARLEVPLESERSLLAASCAAGRILTSFEATTGLTLVDRQVLRALGGEGLLCVPMSVGGPAPGVLVFGLTAAACERVRNLLPWFANFLALTMAGIGELQASSPTDGGGDESFRLQARRVAHEAGNPLGIIKNYLALLDRRLPGGDAAHEDLKILNEEIDRVDRILRRLREPSQEPARGACDVNALVGGMLRLYGEALFAQRGIAVEMALQEGLAPVEADADGLRQVLLNLMKNAAEAMPEGGRLRVATAGGVLLDGVPQVEVVIADSGPGLPAVARAGLAGRPADGLGLSIVRDLLRRQGARLMCRSSAAGTAFTLLLPQGGQHDNTTDEDGKHG